MCSFARTTFTVALALGVLTPSTNTHSLISAIFPSISV